MAIIVSDRSTLVGIGRVIAAGDDGWNVDLCAGRFRQRQVVVAFDSARPDHYLSDITPGKSQNSSANLTK
jgi:hypothetical protein